MGRDKTKVFKVVGTIIFSVLILGGFGYLLWKGEPLEKRYLAFATVALPFLFALLYIGKNLKKLFITLALACHVAAYYFMAIDDNCGTPRYKWIGLFILCGAQLFFMLYTFTLAKGNGARVINLAFRAALCLVAWLILPKYLTLTKMQLVAVIYAINLLTTTLVALLHIKTEWLTFIGVLVLLVCHLHVGFVNGGIEVLNLTGKFADFLTKRDWASYIYVPSLYLIALSSVWAKKKK